MIEISAAKLVIAMYGGLTAFAVALLFAIVYLYYSRRDAFSLKLFLVSGAVLFPVIVAKVLISSLRRGYIPDRLFFYAVFSPKALGGFWLVGTVLVFVLFLRFKAKIEHFSTPKFLFSLYVFLLLFSLGVAGIREGFYGVYEPFTRSHWEYTGNLPFVKSAASFLRNFENISPSLSIHSRIHPPGYTLILYFFQTYFHAGLGGMAILTVMLGGLTLIPLYYFLKNFAGETDVRRGLEIFVLIPSVVMFSATSMETTFLFFSWLAIALVYASWTKNWRYSFLGGLAAAAALFLNYLFLLLLPLFLVLLFIARASNKTAGGLVLKTILILVCFLLAFTALYFGTGYSIIQNFFSARVAQHEAIRSNFESLPTYTVYFLMNLFSFGIYLGIPVIVAMAKRAKEFLRRTNTEESLGFIMVSIFLLIGIFQGEIERIWLFLIPLFVLPLIKTVKDYSPLRFNAFLSLLFFQIIVMQILFYTYW